MYSKELEELIDSVLADGVITDQERAVLRKRALACGEDPDEVMIVVDGRLAKMKKSASPAIPATEKRGNIVKCPHCGAPIEAGAIKCKECGYVFTNVKANNTAKEFAFMLNQKIAKVRYDHDMNNINKVNEFIKNFPLPTGKEDLLEFIASLDARRRSQSYYQEAYNAKYKECTNKAKIQFAGDAQIEALLSRTEKFSISKLSKRQRKTILYAIIAFIIIVGGSLYHFTSSREMAEATAMAKAQCDSLCNIMDSFEVPTRKNYKQIERDLLNLTWADPGYRNDWSYDNAERAIDGYKDKYLTKKRGIASQVYSIYKEIYPGQNDASHWDGLEASLHAPEDIYHPEGIEN
nr:zinc ribbon domain-containing protein [Prevotella sp.]